MTHSEPNARLNVPIRLVANPTGDFAISGASGGHPAAEAGAAIRADGIVSGDGAIASVSHLGNLDAPVGALAIGAMVKTTGDLSFSAGAVVHEMEDVSVVTKIVAPDATAAAGLNLGTPKFTY
jgi:hypothetical protein